MRWGGHVARIVDTSGAYRFLVEKREGKIALGRLRYRWECNIKMELHEVECKDMEWIEVAQDRNIWIRWWTFGFHNLRPISWVAEDILAFH